MNELIVEEIPQAGSAISEEIQQRYTNWKKNTKLLYDYLNTNTSKWPSLSCQFFPDLSLNDDKQRILLSSFTSQQLPQDESVYIGSISTMNHIKWSSINNFDMDEMEFKLDNSAKLNDKQLQEEVRITYPDGDCNRCRYMPQNPDIIGTVSSNGALYVFDRTKHGNKIATGRKFEIECRTRASASESEPDESLSLAWNHQIEGTVATCQSNGKVIVWDLTKFDKTNPVMETAMFESVLDTNGVNDVSWMVNHTSILVSCGESNMIGLIDTRQPPEQSQIHRSTHADGINAIEFNQDNDFLICSGDSQGHVKVWDVRNFSSAVKEWSHGAHDPVSAIQWNPHMPQIVATAGQAAGLVKLWDVSKDTGESLLFVHGGHMLGVNDISWSLHDPWTLCSVSNDNSIHVWKPAKNLVQQRQQQS